MRTAAVLSAAAMALSACNGGGGGGEFFVQTFGDPPNTDLAEFLEDGAVGQRISITQHTGSMTLSEADADDAVAIIEFLFFDGPDLGDLGGGTGAATADGSDENPAHFRGTDTEDNDFIFRIASTGDLEMVTEDEEPNGDGVVFAETIDPDPDIGDDVAFVRFTWPGEVAPDFGELDYMSVVAWVTAAVVAEDAAELTVDFGVGHMGLRTPEADIGDIPADRHADYSGDFVGIFVVPGTDGGGFVATATGDANFTADFGEMEVTGGVDDITVHEFSLAGGGPFNVVLGDIDFVDVTINGSTFAGSVVPDEEFLETAEFHEDSIGTLDGVFYGPVIDVDVDHMGPAEAGAVLTLNDDDSDRFLTGVIGADLLD